MIEKLITKIANTQVFSPDDKLSQMVKKYDKDELEEESLDFVCAARKDNTTYSEFLKVIQDRGKNNK